jgi:uncharacterized PurR-regulated membrane protein YhhQ (DUF165 family)
MLIVAVAAYAAAIVAANLSVAAFGPAISPVNAFLFIGFDLALRDWLHIRLKAWQMLTLIVAAGALSYGLNPAAGIIAVASTTAFVAAAAVDWGVFAAVKGSWLKRSNTSNVAAAAVDSLVFPTIAFGALMPHIVAMQFVAKVLGGALWTWALNNARK